MTACLGITAVLLLRRKCGDAATQLVNFSRCFTSCVLRPRIVVRSRIVVRKAELTPGFTPANLITAVGCYFAPSVRRIVVISR